MPSFTLNSTFWTAILRGGTWAFGTFVLVAIWAYGDLRGDVSAGIMDRADAIEEAIFAGLKAAIVPLAGRAGFEGVVDSIRQRAGDVVSADVQVGKAGNP